MERSSGIPKQQAHLRDYLVVLNRHKWLVVAAVLVTLSATTLHLLRERPAYLAQASVIIEPKQTTQFFAGQSMHFITTDWLDLGTQIETIRTTPVLAAVIRQLNMTTAPEGSLEFHVEVERLKKKIRVELIEDTKVVNIIATHGLPEMAQSIANAVAHAYIEQDRLSRLQTGRDAIKWLSVQLADLKTKLRESEEMFQKFKEQEGIVTLDDSRSEDMVERSRISSNYIATRSSRLEIEAIIDKLESERNVEPDIPIALLNSPTLQKLGIELSQLQTELADKKKLFRDTYPGVIELKDRIQLTEQKILTELRHQRDFLKAQENSFLSQQEAERRESLNLSKKEMEYMALEREVNTNREMYNALLRKVSELSLAGDTDLNSIRIVEPAKLPVVPSGNKMMTLALGACLGIFLGIGSAFFLEYMRNTIETSDDVEQHLGFPVLGVVPQIQAARQSRTPPIIVDDDPKSNYAEAYRSMRTNLLFTNMADPVKTMIVTSTGPGEGKTLTITNLGIALAQAGQRVLLADADLRRPMLHRVFNLDRSKGLSMVLTGEIPVDKAIVKTDIPDLSVLASGSLPSNPSEVLSSVQMKAFMDYVRENYDKVLIDTAPVLGMTDSVVLASEVDAVILVVKAKETTLKALRTVVAQLKQVDAEICGVVLNSIELDRDRYYDYYYYRYYVPYKDDDEGEKRRETCQKNPERKRTTTGIRTSWIR